MNYEKEVRELLGKDAYKTFLDAVDVGKVDLQQMTDISVLLHERVGGNFKRTKNSWAFELNRATARKVLSDWYELGGGWAMDREKALEKFVKSLQDDNEQGTVLLFN